MQLFGERNIFRTALATMPVSLWCLLIAAVSCNDDTATLDGKDLIRRLHYKVSLKTPEIASSDGSIPMWNMLGKVAAGRDDIRLTTSIVNQKGAIWSKEIFDAKDWIFEVSIRIHGKPDVGKDGMALWFTDQPHQLGPTFGGPDRWNGLALIIDSFDDDKQGNNPMIGLYLNNNNFTFDASVDGAGHMFLATLQSCRNRPFPVHIRVSYFQGVVTLETSDGLSKDEKYVFRGRKNMVMPTRGYLGVSASTGDDHPDDHDIFGLLVHSITPRAHAVEIDNAQRKQVDEYMRKAEEMRLKQEKYAQQHPEIHHFQNQQEEYFGSEDMRTLYDMHSENHNNVHAILSKMNEMIGRQESLASMITGMNRGSVSAPGSQASPGSSGLSASQILTVAHSQREIVDSNRQLINEIRTMMMQMQGVQQGSGQLDNAWNQNILGKIDQILVSTRQQNNLPLYARLVSNKLLWLILLVQIIILVGAFLMINRAEQSVKKFY